MIEFTYQLIAIIGLFLVAFFSAMLMVFNDRLKSSEALQGGVVIAIVILTVVFMATI